MAITDHSLSNCAANLCHTAESSGYAQQVIKMLVTAGSFVACSDHSSSTRRFNDVPRSVVSLENLRT